MSVAERFANGRWPRPDGDGGAVNGTNALADALRWCHRHSALIDFRPTGDGQCVVLLKVMLPEHGGTQFERIGDEEEAPWLLKEMIEEMSVRWELE